MLVGAFRSQNYPNPFNPKTTITFDVPGELGDERQVRLTIYDVRGRKVKALVDSELEPGSHRVVWDGRNDSGQRVTSGVYLYTLRSEAKTYTRKMVMVK
ncbi:MAG: FlgD immunoglobulin-like domain containing protein [Candidatus Glassbacteria bacterium]